MVPFATAAVSLLWSLVAVAPVVVGLGLSDQRPAPHRHEPLVFSHDALEPGRVTIYWNQMIPVTKIDDMSSREVYYQMDNATHQLTNEFGPWQTLLADESNVGKVARFVFIKHHLCREKEFRVSWVGKDNDSHVDYKVRLGSSPMPWGATFDANIAKPIYDRASNEIRIGINWNLTSNPLPSESVVVKRPFPVLELRNCTNLFSQWTEEPYFDERTNTFVLDPRYVDSRCEFVVSLNVMTYSAENECKDLYRTSLFSGPIVKLACDEVERYPCEENSSAKASDVCTLQCKAAVTSTALRESAPGNAPYVRVAWQFPAAVTTGRAIRSYTVRTSEVDFTWNNHPIAEYNASVHEFDSNVSETNMKPFSKVLSTFYTFQVCANIDGCSNRPDWTRAPSYPIFVNGLIMNLPPLTTPTPRTTRRTSRTTASVTRRPSSVKQPVMAKTGQLVTKPPAGTAKQVPAETSFPQSPEATSSSSSPTPYAQSERTQTTTNPNSSSKPTSTLLTVLLCYIFVVFY